MSSLKAKYLEGRYEVLGKLGSGGMASLYVVRHRGLDELRVVKVLRREFVGEAGYTAQFETEALATSRLRHPNVVEIYDFISPDPATGKPGLIIMELIRGVDFKYLVTERRLPSLRLSLEIARQSLQALAHLHEHNFVHRDVSPDNLMLTQDYEGIPLVKMIDLGIAKSLGDSDLASEGTFFGKVRYASPERFDSTHELDSRSDVYSFGIVLYELLTGVCPITGRDNLEIIGSHRDASPLPFSETDPEKKVPEELRRLVFRALAKEPAERPASALAFASEIQALQERHPLTSRELAEARRLASEAAPPLLDLNSSPSELDTPLLASPDRSPTTVTLSQATLTHSPFMVGRPIDRDEDLFGRDSEKDLLRDAVERGQMAQILGEPRMGKTSLLRWVERNAPHWQNRPVVRIDAEGLPGYSPERMVLAVAKALDREDQASLDLQRLEGGSRAVGQVLSDLMPLVLLVDTADTLARRGHDFDSDFLGVLRALGEDGALLWVSASRHDLQILFREAARTSRFLNNSGQVWVGRLEDDAARQLVGQLNNPATARRALELAGGFAHGLQSLADQMWRDPEDLEAASNAYAAQVEATFRSWWEDRHGDERALLKQCAAKHVRRSDLERKKLLRALQLAKMGLLSESDDGFAVPDPFWKDYVENAKISR